MLSRSSSFSPTSLSWFRKHHISLPPIVSAAVPARKRPLNTILPFIVSTFSARKRSPLCRCRVPEMAVPRESVAASVTEVTKPPHLGLAPEDAHEKAHHVVKNGQIVRYKNTHPSFNAIVPLTLFRQTLWMLFTGKLKMPDVKPPTVAAVKPTFLPGRTAPDKLRATWLGHACYYVEFPSGLRVLFDPVFEDRCSPLAFMGPKRFTQPPCDIASLPGVDAVLISHSHYDHLSHDTVLEIRKHHPGAHFFAGMGLEKWFRACGIENATELDWWEDVEISVGGAEGAEPTTARISCTPCQHGSGRSLTLRDQNATLWCSWAVRSGTKSVWFGGDTGYRTVPYLPQGVDDYGPEYASFPACPQFRQIGELRGPFDLGLIPIGAYCPRGSFSAVHANPFDAVEIFEATKCKRAMGIHWGTWALTFEEVLEPPRLLKAALERKGIPKTGIFDVCEIGESREF